MDRDHYIQFWVGLEIRGFIEEVEFELEYKSVTFCLKKNRKVLLGQEKIESSKAI